MLRQVVAFLIATPLLLASGPVAAEFIPVQAFPIPLSSVDSERQTVGGLIYRGGLVLKSTEPLFGGFSGIDIDPGGRYLLAIADTGLRMIAELSYSEDGRLNGLLRADISNLSDTDGELLTGKGQSDAESITTLRDGSVVIAFEQDHRLLHYGFQGPPVQIPQPPGLDEARDNGGIEALATLGDNRLVALTEDFRTEDDRGVRGWLAGPDGWSPLTFSTTDRFKPTGASRLPDGDIIVVHRAFNVLDGAAVRISRIKAADIKPQAHLTDFEIARWRTPLAIDNFEGIAARKGQNGETLVYIMSDDNFNAVQQTLLLMFELAAPAETDKP